MGPQYRPQNTIILIIGTPKKVPLILGTTHIMNCNPGCSYSWSKLTKGDVARCSKPCDQDFIRALGLISAFIGANQLRSSVQGLLQLGASVTHFVVTVGGKPSREFCMNGREIPLSRRSQYLYHPQGLGSRGLESIP